MVLLLDRRAINGIIIITSPVGLHQEGEGDEARRAAGAPSAPTGTPPSKYILLNGRMYGGLRPSLPPPLPFPHRLLFRYPIPFRQEGASGQQQARRDGEGAKGRGSRLVLPDYQ